MSRIIPSRRRFLQGVAGVGASAALMPWLQAKAAGDPLPKLILFYTPHGTVWDKWRPTGTETSFSLSPILAPLQAHKNNLVVIDGLKIASPYDHRVPHTYDLPALWTGSPIDTSATDFERTDHGVTFGWNTGTSIDQTLAEALNPDTPFPTIELGVVCGGSHPSSRMIYGGPRAPKNPVDKADVAFDHIFGSYLEGSSAQRRRMSVLAGTRAELASVRPKLSASDRARLDAHETAIFELENSLSGDALKCDLPSDPAPGASLQFRIDQQIDLMTAALGCGLTRIASMQVAKGDNDGSTYPWAGIVSNGHHHTSHDQSVGAQDELAELYTWYAARFAHLLDRLADTPDGDGTSLLDNSIVIWGSEIGVGWNHNIDNVPFVVAGGGMGRVRTGRYLRVPGNQHNRVLVDAAQVMGVPGITSYGSTDNGSGGVPGLLNRG